MDSPEISKIKATTTSSSDSPLVQDSPVFSYINNLSPIKPVKATHGAQGFPGLNSPPLVFTSPHLKSHREASFLKRPQDPHLSSAEKPKTQDEAQKFGNGPVASKKHITQLHMGLITDTQDCEAKTCVESHPCSSSEGVDEYLADPMEVDCASPAQSVNLCLNKSDNVPGTIIGSNEVTVFDNKRDTGTDSRIETEAPLITSEQAKEDLERKQSFDVKPVRIKLQSDGELPSDKCPNIESGVSVDNAFKRDYHHGQDIGGGHRDDCDYTPQSPPGRLQSVQVYENCAENVDSISKGMIGNMILHAPKARSDRMHRRCLQFEESPPCAIGKQDSYSSPIGKVNNSKPPAGTAESKMVKLSYPDLKATSKRQMTTSLPPRYGGNSPLTGSKPSGIGLHLNSIVNAAPVVRGATRSIKLADHYIGVQVMNSASVKSCHLPENPRCLPVSLNVVEKDSDGPEDRNEAETSVAASSAITQSPGTVEFHCNGPPHEKRKFGSQDVESYKECNQSSPKKKRTRTSSSKDSDGCKRCNCKKTKCLKLYCDCFAAGVYCDEPCACQGCFNKPDYEDTVLETRKHIESRNPLAFAPKIVLREEEIQSTPSSARHKRGCNCKKSMCLKKYCECYQANVGCSNGCRCEGCKNVYGRKGDYIPIEHGATKDSNSDKASRERIESTFDEKLEMVATNKDILSAELYDSHNLIPLTPSLQGSGHANNLPPSSCLPTSYLLSPEPDLTIITSNEKSTRSSIGNSESNDILLETSKELTDMGSYDWRLDYESTGMADTFSPRFDAAPTTCRITPVSDLPSVDMASSTSSKTGDWTNASQLQLCPGSQGLSSGSSLHWRTSPVTPITRLGEGTKSFQGPDVENGLNDILQDDTPEILKDNSTSSRLVKVSSPNKKRVSPPHSHNQEVGASSSGALRSGRKFILKAVPSFPPLTPCINSKGSSITSQYTSNPQEKGRKK